MTLTIGQTVRLKSGGPDMTVVQLVNGFDGQFANVSWVGAGDLIHHYSFPLACLEVVQ